MRVGRGHVLKLPTLHDPECWWGARPGLARVGNHNIRASHLRVAQSVQPDAGGAQPGESRRDHWAGGPATHLQAPGAPVGLCLGEEEMGGPEAEPGEGALLSAFVCVGGLRTCVSACVCVPRNEGNIHP